MADIKFYEGIPVGKKWSEYSEQELSILPPVPPYPKDRYSEPPFIWNGSAWDIPLD